MGVTQPGLLHRTRNFFFPPGVQDLAEFEAFVTGEAAYLAQKTVFGYCRVKTVSNYEKLMTEPAFRDGVELCRWEAYAGTLGDTLIMAEGLLRPADPVQREKLADRLGAFYGLWLNRHVPPHRSDWADCIAAFAARFAVTRAGAPLAPDAVVQGTAAVIHTTVPLHERLKRNDREVILGDLRLHAVALHGQMLKRFDRAALTAALLAGTPG